MLRLLAGHCFGNVCAFSIQRLLVLSVLILVLVAVTGLAALPIASRRHQRSAWPLAIGVSTLLSFFGPLVSLVIFRYSPDQFFPVATVLVALLPVVVLAYSFAAKNER